MIDRSFTHRLRNRLRNTLANALAPTLGAVLAAGLFAPNAARAELLLKDGDVVALCGDSITEQKQYSVFIEAYLLAAKPARNLRTVQIGWSGEQAVGFNARIGSDVLPFKPTFATMCYGMNDGAYGPVRPDITTRYHDAMKASVEALKAGGVRTVLVGSAGAVDTSTYAKRIGGDARLYNQTLDALRQIAADTAKETASPFADVHTPMMDAMAKSKAKYGEKFPFAGGDGVHPGSPGHFVMAYAFLKGLGCSGDIGTITVDLAANKNETTWGHRIVSAGNSEIHLESTRYPFCFAAETPANDTERAMLPFVPFVDELDRLTLIVKNAGAGKLRVSWGEKTAEFTSDELGKGINLVAAFPDNPFNEAFDRVKKAARAQQEFETLLTKSLLHSVPDEKQRMPEAAPQVDALIAVAMKHDQQLADATAAEANKPVSHTIKIEPIP